MACDLCGKTAPIMVPMQPGKDGKPWEYCVRCWIEGRQPFKLGMFKEPTLITDPHLADALTAASKRTAGLIDMSEDSPKGKKPRAARSRPKPA